MHAMHWLSLHGGKTIALNFKRLQLRESISLQMVFKPALINKFFLIREIR